MAGSQYEVLLAQELESIYDYIAGFNCKANADHMTDRLLEIVENLATFPERGTYLKELIARASVTTGRPPSSPVGWFTRSSDRMYTST